METFGHNKEKERFFDVGVSRRHTVNLKPAFYFYKKYPFGAIGAVILLVLLFFGARKVLTRAEVADFYPTACLGDWQSPQNAQGLPENLTMGFASSTFNASNSAIFAASSTRIFCGGFLPPDFKQIGEIKRVGISFIWNVVGGVTEQPNSTEETATSLTGTPPEIPLATSTLPGNSATLTTLFSPKIRFWPLNSWWPILTAFAEDASATSAIAIDVVSSTSPLPNETTTTPIVFEGTQIQASSSEASSTPIILGPPLTATLSPLATTTATSTTTATTEAILTAEATDTASSTLPTPPPDENFLEVSYSTDGASWIAVAKISQTNWQNFTISLPISNWDDLRKLQIKVSGTPTSLTELPTVNLDGMFVEVQYDLPPLLDVSLQVQETETVQVPTVKTVMKIFDPESKHKCRVTPFSQGVKRSDMDSTSSPRAAAYHVSLLPSFENAGFRLQTGDLPPGVSATLDPERGVGASTPRLTLNVEDGAGPGSFDVVVVYREIDNNSKELANFCQLNLIVE